MGVERTQDWSVIIIYWGRWKCTAWAKKTEGLVFDGKWQTPSFPVSHFPVPNIVGDSVGHFQLVHFQSLPFTVLSLASLHSLPLILWHLTTNYNLQFEVDFARTRSYINMRNKNMKFLNLTTLQKLLYRNSLRFAEITRRFYSMKRMFARRSDGMYIVLPVVVRAAVILWFSCSACLANYRRCNTVQKYMHRAIDWICVSHLWCWLFLYQLTVVKLMVSPEFTHVNAVNHYLIPYGMWLRLAVRRFGNWYTPFAYFIYLLYYNGPSKAVGLVCVRLCAWAITLHMHRAKWRHRVYGHDTIAILWVQRDVVRWVKWRRFIVLFN